MSKLTLRNTLLGIGSLLAVQVGVLLYFGQPSICTCGYIKFWEGVVLSEGNSQHVLDWYTFSHIIHGFIFYVILWRAFPKLSVAQRLLYALGIEIAWEIAENTPYVIDLYRQQALSLGYAGDSILNSISDSLAMIVGFILARRIPLWLVVVLAIVMELIVGYLIRDNLTLNVLNFIHSFDFINAWQAAAI